MEVGERRQQIQALLERAVEISDPAELQAFLEKATAGDPELRTGLESLLDARRRAAAEGNRFLNAGGFPLPHGEDVSSICSDPTAVDGGQDALAATASSDSMPLAREVRGSKFGPLDAVSDAAVRSLLPNVESAVERYEIINEAGRGGMGVVYRARHRFLKKDVALKITLPGASANRFLREARLLASVQSRFVVPVHDFDILPDGSPMLVMEWVDGMDLSATLQESGKPLPEASCLQWMQQVAEGLSAAAELGIIHRDIKPSNILIDRQQRVRIVDFGLARGTVEPGDLSAAGSIVGTPHYMAPEQAETPASVDTRADIYSFGAAFYHLLTGKVPFTGDSAFTILYKHKTAPLVAPRALNPALSENTAGLLERCLAKSPAERFSSFGEILSSLKSFSDSEASPEDSESDTKLAVFLTRYRQRRSIYLEESTSLAEPDVYSFPNGRQLRILYGDIVQQETDAIVSSDDKLLSMGGGVSHAIRRAAGPQFQEAVQEYVPVRPGRVVVTPAGRIKSRFVFHAVTLASRDDRILWPSRDLIVELLHSCFYHADTLQITSLSLPLLGSGVGRIPRDVCLDTMFRTLAKTLLRGLTEVREVRIVLHSNAPTVSAASHPEAN